MSRVAIMVDAGYFFAAGSALLSQSGQKKRNSLTFDEKAAVAALKQQAQKVTGGTPVLRVYWYDGAGRTGPSAEHARIANCDDMKLRLGFLNPAGQQKGVDSLIVTDLVELARNHAISEVLLLSSDEDVRIGVQLAQSFGVRVHLLGIEPSRGSQSIQLRQEADTCSEWGKDVISTLLKIRSELLSPPKKMIDNPSADIATVIRGVVKALIDALGQPEVDGIAQYMTTNRRNLPQEFDGKLLAKTRAIVGRDLEPAEKSAARRQFREYLESKLRKKLTAVALPKT